jgi:hypothetical protein
MSDADRNDMQSGARVELRSQSDLNQPSQRRPKLLRSKGWLVHVVGGRSSSSESVVLGISADAVLAPMAPSRAPWALRRDATREAPHSASPQQAPRAHLGASQIWGSTRDRDRARDRHPQLPSLIGSRCDAGCSAHSHGCSAQRGAVPAKAVTAGGGGPRWHVLGPTPRGRRACERRCLWGRCRSCHCRGPDDCAVPRRGTFL